MAREQGGAKSFSSRFDEHFPRWELSRLTTLGQAVGDDEGLEIEVIDVEQKMGKGKAKDAEGE